MTARLVMVGWLVLLVVLVARWWRSRDGRVVASGPGSSSSAVTSAVLVSTPTCRTCPQVRAALATVSDLVEQFSFAELDASRDLEFVRANGVLRAPTVLFRDAQGIEVARAAGPVTVADVAAAIGCPPDVVVA